MDTERQTTEIESEKNRRAAAEHAVAYALRRMAEVPEIYWHCGEGSGLHNALTASRAMTTGTPQDEIKWRCRPGKAEYAAFLAEKKRLRAIQEYLREQLQYSLGGDAAPDTADLILPVWLFRGKPAPDSAAASDEAGFNN